jgi:hypothetical protein
MNPEWIEVIDANVEGYYTKLMESRRSSSKGGNTKALRKHSILIEGEEYSFLAIGNAKFVYEGETISFRYRIKKIGEKEYNNVDKHSVISKNSDGKEFVRGNRDYKQTLRTAIQRMPASKREQRD